MARTRTDVTADSQQVISANTQSLMDQQNHVDQVRSTKDTSTTIVGSLMPASTRLNAPVVRYDVHIDMDYVTALQEQQKARTRQDIPTADYVKSNSFKVGTKMLIKIEPSSSKLKEKISEYIPSLVFDKFSLQAISETDSERYQLHETFEDNVLFMFGRRPRIWTMQGIVLNGRRGPAATEFNPFTGSEPIAVREARLAKDMDWTNRFLQDWEDFYRGSKAVELQARTFLTYDDSVIEATLLEMTAVRNAQIPSAVNVTLTFVVHQRAFIGQEYRNGFTAENLSDLIARTNSSLPFEDKEFAPEIKPVPASLEELKRQKAEAEANLIAAQNGLTDIAEQGENVAQAKSVAQEEREQAESDLSQATKDRKAAQEIANTATDPEVRRTAQEAVADAAGREYEARSARDEAESRRQAAELAEGPINTEIDARVAVEGDAQQVNDALAQAIESHGAVAITEETYTEQEIVQQLEDKYGVSNVKNVRFTDTDKGVFVEFTADYSDESIGDGVTRVRVLQ